MFRCGFQILLISMIGMPLIALTEEDKLCEHLVSFASKTNVGDSLQIKLINDWANLSKN